MKILVIQQKMIGDVLTSTIIFEILRKNFNNAELHFVINEHTKAVVEHNPYIDQLKIVTPEIEHHKIKFLSFCNHLRNEQYDIVIDVYCKIGSLLMVAFSKANTRIGFAKWYSKILFTHTFKNKKVRSQNINLASENRLMLLKPLIKNIDYNVNPKIYIKEKEKTELLKKLNQKNIHITTGNYIMVNILGSQKEKTYPLDYMANLLNDIISKFPDLKLLFNYIPKQQNTVDKLVKLCNKKTQQNICPYYSESLREFLVLSTFCRAIIGNEGGAINMGKALGIPTFAIFSPWIRKESWGASKNDHKNITVHLKDFRPNLFVNYNRKLFKKRALTLYNEFEPKFFVNEICNFIESNLNPRE